MVADQRHLTSTREGERETERKGHLVSWFNVEFYHFRPSHFNGHLSYSITLGSHRWPVPGSTYTSSGRCLMHS